MNATKLKSFHFETRDPKQTLRLGVRLAELLAPGDLLCLEGDLGSGKTTLVKGIAKGLWVEANKVNSPTFVLMNIYEGKLPLYHFDLYRLDDPKEILRLDYEEYFFGEGVSLVEWADKLGPYKPLEYLDIKLAHTGENSRSITLTPIGERYARWLKAL